MSSQIPICDTGMGDMKTPDFDDLLAAFDIPDIDAKEAIQSVPEDSEGHHSSTGGAVGKIGGGGGSGLPLRPPSPPEPHQTPHATALSSQSGEPPGVSVIVKNRVRTDAFGEGECDSGRDGPGGAGAQGGAVGALPAPRLGLRMQGMGCGEPLIHNGFEECAAEASELPLSPTQTQSHSNGQLWSPASPKAAAEGASATSAGGFGRAKPLGAQGPNDTMPKARKPSVTQPQEEETHAGDVADRSAAVSASSDAPSSHLSTSPVGRASTFFSPPAPPASTSPVGRVSTFFSPPAPPPLSSSTAPPSPPSNSSSLFEGPLLPSSPLPSGSQLRSEVPGPALQRAASEDEESEPDLGSSPLVIQESPDLLMCSPPKFPRRKRSSSSGMFSSPSPTASPTNLPTPATAAAPPLADCSPRQRPPSPKRTPAEQRNPEHVIEERDSPESPEPEPPASSQGKRATTLPTLTQRGPSTDQTSAPPPAAHGATWNKAEEEEEEEEDDDDEDEEEEEETMMTREEQSMETGGSSTGERVEDGEEQMEVGEQDCSPGPAAVNTDGSPSPSMMKVRIRTVKTPTGSITRTVTRVAPNGVAATGTTKDASTKASLGGQKVIRPKRPGAPLPGQNQRSKGATVLPVSTLQDASTAMLLAASKAQNKMAAASGSSKLSATAVSITKATTLPSVSSSPATSSVGASARSAAQKPVNGSILASTVATLTTGSGGNKPASIVNSGGAVISRSQSSLVEAFNKILNSKNLLPSYKPDLSTPPPAEWALPMPAAGYRCLECGDSFALERSLARHYDRRSLRIEVTCNHCAKRLAFFNKCSLLLHAREHKERGLVMQCSHLVMRPVSVEQMIGQQDTTPIGVLSTPVSSSACAPGASSPGKEESASLAGPQVLLPLPCKKAEPLQYTNNRCPECKSQFSGKAEMVAHFQEVKASANTACTQCTPPMLLPNPCSWSAHQRIHRHRSPHVCPECGGVARQASFHTHLQEACLHFTRRIGYRCFSCQVVFGGLNSVKSHIQSSHCEVFHKCPSCPMAFKSAPSAQSHISSQHPTLTSVQAKMIYKCVMCETVFTQKALLYVHFDTHLANQKVHVFKCPDCPKLYAQRASMMEHMKTAHRGSAVKQEVSVAAASSPIPTVAASSSSSSPALVKGKALLKMESSDGEEWGREHEEDAEEEGGKPGGRANGGGPVTPTWSCTQCQTRYTDKENYITHMAELHDKVLKKFPCDLCEGSFSSSSSLRRHIRLKHKDNRRLFLCQLCVDSKRSFSSRLSLERHMQTQHAPGPPLPGRPVDRPKRGSVFSEAADSSSELDATVSSLGGASAEEDSRLAGPPGGMSRGRGGVVKQEETTGFRCMPCGFATEDQAEFLAHIPSHRGGDGALQCQQCGACFASGPSLSRHRFISHRVRDAVPEHHHHHHAATAAAADTDGLADGELGVDALGSGAGSPGSLSPSQQQGDEEKGPCVCRVCGRRFNKASDLNTHFRTHGMAFITAHKTDKPV
ncbi:zinc finger protein 687b-like isoform X2 [Alosa alosa]|uniref:zinc finger protein 687b-like isoform X2 n=1 Tax=Alosa alosa TaxID=278164 RepID=UPI0020152A29|nr:zinc finger protein 687b-like isoform X2 [Alosa alosa]